MVRRARTALIIASLSALSLTLHAQVARPAAVRLEAAIKQQLVDGNLTGAIAEYEQITREFEKSDPTVAAQALLRTGQAYDLRGDARARAAYDRVIREFPGQTDVVAAARRRLGAIAPAEQSGPAPRVVAEDLPGLAYGNVTPDGRLAAFILGNDIGIRDMNTGMTTRVTLGLNPRDDLDSVTLSRDGMRAAFVVDPDNGPNTLHVISTRAGERPRQLVSRPDLPLVQLVAWSPDGTSILVGLGMSDRTFQFAWISAADGSMSRQRSLGRRYLPPMGASLSPDGRTIVYAAAPNDAPATTGTTTRQDTHLYLAASDGSGTPVPLVTTATQNVRPAWMPDGNGIVFLSDQASSFGLWGLRMQEGRPVGAPVLLQEQVDARGALATAGDAALYTETGTRYDITVGPLAGGTGMSVAGAFEPTPPPMLGRSNEALSPDGQRLAFIRERPGGNRDVVVRARDTGEERGFAAARVVSVAWFHDNRRILVATMPEGLASGPARGTLYAVWRTLDTVSGRFADVLASDITEARAGEAIALDDRTLYFGARRTVNGAVRDSIVALDLTTFRRRDVYTVSAESPLADGTAPFGGLRIVLSRDGRTLAFAAGPPADQRVHIWRVGVDGSNPRDISGAAGAARPLGWSADGQWVLFYDQVSGDGRIMRVASAGGTPEPSGVIVARTRAGSEALWGAQVSLSSDGSQVIVGWRRTMSRLLAIDNIAARLGTGR